MKFLGFLMVMSGAGLFFWGWFSTVVTMFRDDRRIGLAGCLFAFIALIYAFINYQEMKRKILLMLGGAAVAVLGNFLQAAYS